MVVCYSACSVRQSIYPVAEFFQLALEESWDRLLQGFLYGPNFLQGVQCLLEGRLARETTIPDC